LPVHSKRSVFSHTNWLRMVGLVVLSIPALAVRQAEANSAGPQLHLTGGFQEGSCIRCHSGHTLNEGRSLGGDFRIDGVPRSYVPGQTYTLTVLIAHPGQSRWGYEMSARFAESGRQAGTLLPKDGRSQVKGDEGIFYVLHTAEGSRKGEKDGPAEFRVSWTAPQGPGGLVIFNAAGNAADGSDTPEGDYIYATGSFSRAGSQAPAVEEPVEISAATVKTGGRMQETSRIVDLPTPVDLKKGSMEILIQHRFLDSVAEAGAGNAFGVDSGANMNIGINYGLSDRLSFGIARTRFGQIVELSGTYEIRTNKESKLKLALRGGVEGTQNFKGVYSGSMQLASAYDTGRIRFNVVPTMVFNSRPEDQLKFNAANAINPNSNHTFALGLGTDILLNRRMSLIAEYIPRLAGFGGFYERQDQVAGGLVIRTWGHVFTITVATSRDFTPGNYAVNSGYSDVSLGFNLYRRMH
jgi:hypothetical protein